MASGSHNERNSDATLQSVKGYAAADSADAVLGQDPVTESSPSFALTEDEKNTWEKYSHLVLNHEKDVVKEWRDEIDTLLVFAGLFSAVLTAFNVQYYTQLQPSPTTHITVTSGTMNVSFLADAGTSSAQAPATTVAINILWFLSLVFSLAAASIGISAKQWLSHYVVPETVIAIQRLRIWHLRYQRFREWHVPQIIEALPFLLQLSLALFLVGVAVLLWSLHLLVGIIVTIPTGVLLLFTLGTWITPAWVPGCPYKSPQARWVYRLFRRLSWNDGIIHREDTEGRLSYLSRITQAAPPVRDWLAREEDWIHSVSVPFAVASTDVAVAVDRVLQKDDFLQEAILPAVARVDAVTACNVVNDVVCSRAHIASLAQLYDTSANGAVAWFYDAVNIKTIMVLGDLAMNTLPAVSKHSYDPPALALAYRPNGQTRVQGLLALLNHVLRAIPVGERQTHCHRLAEWFVRNEIHLLDRRTFPQTHEIALWLISVHWIDFTHSCPHELRAKFLDLVVEMLDSWMQGYRRVDKSARLEARDLAREQKIWDLYGLIRPRQAAKLPDGENLVQASATMKTSVGNSTIDLEAGIKKSEAGSSSEHVRVTIRGAASSSGGRSIHHALPTQRWHEDVLDETMMFPKL